MTTFQERANQLLRLILVPALITLGVTILRLGGELLKGPAILFGRAAVGAAAIVGISWLPLLFGPFFALRLRRSEAARPSLARLWICTLLGIVPIAVLMIVAKLARPSPTVVSVLGFVASVAVAAIVFAGWPALARALVAYGFAARIPVAIIMLLAIHGHWATHYDATPPGYQSLGLWWDWLVIGVVPQIFAWVPFTVFAGSLAGAVALSLVRIRQAA